MQDPRDNAARVPAAPAPTGRGVPWPFTWQHGLTVLLLVVTVPVLLVGAAIAAVVAAPLLLGVGCMEALRLFPVATQGPRSAALR